MIKVEITKNKKRIACILFLCALLSGCGDNPPQNPVVSPSPDNGAVSDNGANDINNIISSLQIPTPSPDNGNSLTPAAQEWVAQFETFPFGSHPVTEATSAIIPNSNLCNLGYLCEAPDGTIYYSISTASGGTIYHANADGSQQTMIMDRRVHSLQFDGGRLYFWDEDTSLVCAYNPITQTTETVFDTKVGHALVSDGRIYYCVTGGIYCFDQETGVAKLLTDTDAFLPVWTAMTEDVLIYVLVDETDPAMLSSNALLFAYSFQEGKSYYLCPYAWMPLLAGSQIFYQNIKTAALESLDLNSGEIHSFNFHTSRPSLSENTLYFYQFEKGKPALKSCNLSTGETTICLELEETKQINYLYQTDRCVYIFTADSKIYYYDKTNGSSGKF